MWLGLRCRPVYKICFFVPKSHAEQVKQALFEAGAGRAGHYDQYCWETEGIGQFRALSGSSPFIGAEGVLEKLPELKVETICEDAYIKPAVDALRKAHPYESPALDIWRVECF